MAAGISGHGWTLQEVEVWSMDRRSPPLQKGERRRSQRVALEDKYCELGDKLLRPENMRTVERSKAIIRAVRGNLETLDELRREIRTQKAKAWKAVGKAPKGRNRDSHQ